MTTPAHVSSGGGCDQGTTADRPGDLVVLRRPQFHLAGNELYFLISKRPHAVLAPPEAQVWAALRDETPLKELRGRFPDHADQVVRRLVEIEVCDLAPVEFRPGRRRVTVIEPHSDDAILSVGGTMSLRAQDCEFTVATVASRSNFTSYYRLDRCFFDAGKVSALRAAEGRLTMRVVGGRYAAVGRTEAALRYRDEDWSLDWFRAHQLSARMATGRRYGDADLRDWTAAARSLLADSDAEEIWLPIGVGPHCDHQLTRDAFLSALMSEPSIAAGRTIKLYQEVPYGVQNPGYTERLVIALTCAGAVLTPEIVHIDTVLDQKLRLVSAFASQFKMDFMTPKVQANARLAGGPGGGTAELLWRVERLPDTLDFSSLYINQDAVATAGRRLSRWLPRHRETRRIRVLLLVPQGRWAYDVETLLRRFPRATLDVYVAPAATAEVMSIESPRIRVHRVGRGMKAWAALALRLMCARPTPVLFVSGADRLPEARRLATLWPLSDTLVVGSMDHFHLGLDRLARS